MKRNTVEFWQSARQKICTCYSGNTGCDNCASNYPAVYLPPGEERVAALKALDEYTESLRAVTNGFPSGCDETAHFRCEITEGKHYGKLY